MSTWCPTPGHGVTAHRGMYGTGAYTTPGITGTSARRGHGVLPGHGAGAPRGRGAGARLGLGLPAGDPAGITAGRLRLRVRSHPQARRVLTLRHMPAVAAVRRQEMWAPEAIIVQAHRARLHAPAIWAVDAQVPPAQSQTPAHIVPRHQPPHRVPAIWAVAEWGPPALSTIPAHTTPAHVGARWAQARHRRARRAITTTAVLPLRARQAHLTAPAAPPAWAAAPAAVITVAVAAEAVDAVDIQDSIIVTAKSRRKPVVAERVSQNG